MDETIAFDLLHPRLWISLHVLGVCIGLGGATITDVLFFKFLKDFRISNKEADVMRTLSHIIIAALLLILVSGVALYLPNMAMYNATPAFIAKMTIVLVLTLNGLVLHEYISPKLVRLSFSGHHRATPRLRGLRHLAFGLGALSVTSWYYVFFLAMLKNLLPADAGVPFMLGAYAFLLVVAVTCSQAVEHRLHRHCVAHGVRR